MSEDPTARTTVTTVSARPTIRVALPQGWARSMLSGIEAALLGCPDPDRLRRGVL